MVLLIILPWLFYRSAYRDKRSSFRILQEGFSDWNSRLTVQLKSYKQNYNICYNYFLGKWIRDNLPRSISIAYEQMGQVPYYAGTDYYFIDLIGLTDIYIASCYKRLNPSALGLFIKEVFGMLPFLNAKSITDKTDNIFHQGDPTASQDIVQYVLEK